MGTSKVLTIGQQIIVLYALQSLESSLLPASYTIGEVYLDLRFPQSPAAKKRGHGKPSHACDFCKAKNLRCDRVKSSCNSCENFRVRCSFADRNPHSNEQKPEDEDMPEEQTQNQRLRKLDSSTEEEPVTIAGYEVQDNVLTTISRPEDRGFATARTSGPVMDDVETEDDITDFGPLGRPFLISRCSHTSICWDALFGSLLRTTWLSQRSLPFP